MERGIRLTRASLGKARSGIIRRKLITVPATISISARKTVLHPAPSLAMGNTLLNPVRSGLPRTATS